MKYLLAVISASLLFAACKPAIKPETLYGTWKYTKLESPNANPPGSMDPYLLQSKSPTIRFTRSDSVVIMWSDTVLMKGTFTINGSDIEINQLLPGGKTSQFPFSVFKLTDKELIFESHGEDGSKVTAVKE
jgi:hypothetical protein